MASAISIETSFLFILEEEDFLHQKAQKKFWAPGDNHRELTTLRVLVWMLFPEPKKQLDRKNCCIENLDRQTARWKSNMFHESI